MRAIITAGHPAFVSRTQAAKRYGVTASQICQDIQAIGLEVGKSLKEKSGELELEFYAVYQSGIRKALREQNEELACKLEKEFQSFIQGRPEASIMLQQTNITQTAIQVKWVDKVDKDKMNIPAAARLP